jgi:hypothetical protein
MGLCAACALLLQVSAAPAADSHIASDVLRYLGLPPASHREALERCRVVHSGAAATETLSDEVAAIGAMILVSAPHVQAVVAGFLHSDTFQQVHEAKRFRDVAQGPDFPPPQVDFSSLPTALVDQMAERPQRVLNLSVPEASRLTAGASGPQRRSVLARNLSEILAARAKEFSATGIRGIEPYERSDGTLRNPGTELEAAIRSLAILDREFPHLAASLRGGTPAARSAQQLHWIEAPFDGTRVWALSSETRQELSDRAAGADMHSYASGGYNAMLTIVAIVPYDERWLVFAINHTFTDAVLGFGSSIRRGVARKQIAERLARHLEAAREQLPNGSRCVRSR